MPKKPEEKKVPEYKISKSHKKEGEKPNINPFYDELKKFIGQDVVVHDIEGNEHEGNCRAISFNHLNVIIMTKFKKIVIKNIISMRRKRSYKGEE